MKIEHVAIWTRDIERLRAFYEKYFSAVASDKYVNVKKQFESYFLTFSTGARLEIMTTTEMRDSMQDMDIPAQGYVHVAFSVGTKEKVDEMTAILQEAGHEIVDGPRFTGDGYYESKTADPDGNWIEITL